MDVNFRIGLLTHENGENKTVRKVFISRCYAVAMCNMQHNALNLIFCTVYLILH